jgi:hypothetical protein
MKYDYTHLNHNLLMSPKTNGRQGVIIKGVYCMCKVMKIY